MAVASGVLLSFQIETDNRLAGLAGSLGAAMIPGSQQTDLLFKQYIDRKGPNPVAYVENSGVYRNLGGGELTATGFSLDFGLIGQGYFKILTPEGVRYGRNGRAHLGPNREVMVGMDGIMLTEDDAPLILPEGSDMNDLHVSPDLGINIGQDYLGKLGVVRFEDQQKMTYLKNRNLFETQQEALPPTDEEGNLLVQVQQGSYEKSNINASLVLFQTMELQRNWIATDEFVKKRNEAELEHVNSWISVKA